MACKSGKLRNVKITKLLQQFMGGGANLNGDIDKNLNLNYYINLNICNVNNVQ